jgi:hypothetical protein
LSKEPDKPKDEKENHGEPRWKEVSELYDILDKSFVEYGQEHDMTFIEMDLVLYMLNEKIFQQKVMTLGMADMGTVGINGNSGMYR